MPLEVTCVLFSGFYSLKGYADFGATISKMPEISNVKNALQTVVKKDRLLNAVFAGSKSLVVSLGRTAYAFWLQTTGLIFLFFTLGGGYSLFRQYRRDHFADHQRLWIESAFTLVCGYFTLVSFLKARRTAKRK
jgi:uncharacterized membrane protein